MRKRRALRSLSQEPVKRTRRNGSGSLPPGAPSAPSSGRNPTRRVTRSLTPHQQQPHQQLLPKSVELSESPDTTTQPSIKSILEDGTKSRSDLPCLPQQQGGDSSDRNETEKCADEQMQISITATEMTSSQDAPSGPSSTGEEDRIHAATDCQTEGEQLSKVSSHDKKGDEENQHEMGSQTSCSQEQTAEPKVSTEVASPRRYSTRRQGRGQGNIVEKLTQSYSDRIEQALGSPDKKKKTFQSPKRTLRTKVPPKASAKPVRRNSRRSRSNSNKSKCETGGENEAVHQSQAEHGEDEGEIPAEENDSRVSTETPTPQIESGKSEGTSELTTPYRMQWLYPSIVVLCILQVSVLRRNRRSKLSQRRRPVGESQPDYHNYRRLVVPRTVKFRERWGRNLLAHRRRGTDRHQPHLRKRKVEMK